MQQSEKGTWKAELKGNQKGLYYTYKVKIGDKWIEAVDPYARASFCEMEIKVRLLI